MANSRFGEAIAERREQLGYEKTTDFARAIAGKLAKAREKYVGIGGLSQQTLSRLERDRDGSLLGVMQPDTARALGYVLEWSAREFRNNVGVGIPLVPFYDDEEKLAEPERPVVLHPIPDELREAIEIYGARFSDLQDPVWQQYLASFRPRGMRDKTPEDWLDFYRNLARHGVVPGVEN